jgi:hypothetical protein
LPNCAWSPQLSYSDPGTIPHEVREHFGMRWTRRNERAFDAFRRAVAWSWPAVPQRIRIMPRARAAYRTRGRLGVRAALAAAQARGRVEPDLSAPRAAHAG